VVENEHKFFKAIPLKKLSDLNSRYFKQMKHAFRFNIKLPDPNPSAEIEANRQVSQLGTIGTVEVSCGWVSRV
jgi:hypothetical protein